MTNTDTSGLIRSQRDFYYRDSTKTYDFRIRALKRLKRVLKDNEENILKALKEDLGKSSFESYITEYALVMEELDFAIKNLKKWMKRKRSQGHFLPSPIGPFTPMSLWE